MEARSEAKRPISIMPPVVALVGALAAIAVAIGPVAGNEPSARDARFAAYRRPAEIPFPAANPYSDAKHRLGQMLFFDPILSGSKSHACASCHNPGLSWADGRMRAIGEKQEALPLRSPTLLNVAWTPKLGWDGHFRNLESVAVGPLTAPGNMNLPEAAMIQRLSAVPAYTEAFDAAFGEGDITRAKVEQALATFERTIVSTRAAFDRWVDGDENALGDAAKRGFALFNGKANCAACHNGWAFTDGSFHDIGSAQNDDIGRGKLFPNSVALRYAFKTPTLRDAVRRGPYMHDGSVATLREVIELYDRGGIERPSRDEAIRPLGLSDGEKDDLVAFIDSLTGEPQPVPVPILPR